TRRARRRAGRRDPFAHHGRLPRGAVVRRRRWARGAVAGRADGARRPCRPAGAALGGPLGAPRDGRHGGAGRSPAPHADAAGHLPGSVRVGRRGDLVGARVKGAVVHEITDGLRFPEGPIAMDDGSVLVVEIEGGALTRVTPDGQRVVVAECGGGPNGAAVGPDGSVYVANDGGLDFMTEDDIRFPYALRADNPGGHVQRVHLTT